MRDWVGRVLLGGMEGIRIPGRRWLVLGAVAWAAAVAALPAGATRFVMLTIEELARGADAVVHARVEALETSRDAAGRIHTRVELAVDEVWKGSMAAGRWSLVAGGGTLGETTVRAVGQAEYSVGDEVVAYLVRTAAGEWVTLGMAQGRFQVNRDDATGRGWVRNLFWGGAMEGGKGRTLSWPPSRPLSLEELKRRTREVAL